MPGQPTKLPLAITYYYYADSFQPFCCIRIAWLPPWLGKGGPILHCQDEDVVCVNEKGKEFKPGDKEERELYKRRRPVWPNMCVPIQAKRRCRPSGKWGPWNVADNLIAADFHVCWDPEPSGCNATGAIPQLKHDEKFKMKKCPLDSAPTLEQCKAKCEKIIVTC